MKDKNTCDDKKMITIRMPKFRCVCVFQYMEEFAELLLPITDVRHQVVERVVQHLAQRNKDIPEVSNVSWSVHVVQSPTVNAFVLPVSRTAENTELQVPQFITQLKSYKQHFHIKLCFFVYFCVLIVFAFV